MRNLIRKKRPEPGGTEIEYQDDVRVGAWSRGSFDGDRRHYLQSDWS
jgi:hypothetical protein